MSAPSRFPWQRPSPAITALPPAILARSRARLSVVMLAAGVFLSIGQLGAVVMYLAAGRGAAVYLPGGDAVSAGLCLALFFTVRSRRLSDAVAVAWGLRLQVLLCLSLFFCEVCNGSGYHGVPPPLSWGTFFVALVPLLVPCTPRAAWTLPALAGLMAPLAVGAAVVLYPDHGVERPWATALSLIPAQAFAVFIAIAGSKVLRGASVDVLELEQHQRLLETLLRDSGSSVVLADGQGRVLFVNDEAVRFFGGSGVALPGRQVEEVLSALSRELQEAWRGRVDTLVTFPRGGELETVHVLRRSVEFGFRPCTVLLLRRLTAVLRAREVSAYKRLIRVFAHELNNSQAALGSMVGSVKLASQDSSRAHLVPGALAHMEDCVANLGRFLERYIRFARLPSPRKEPVEWAPFLRGIEGMVAVRSVGPAPQRAGCFDRAQIQQVLLNLLKNAHEAGGAPEQVELEVTESGGGFCLEVSDRGSGLTEEAREMALTPLFTTKAEGTGLGLSISLEIVEAHGGQLHLSAREGGGTRVRCWLPA